MLCFVQYHAIKKLKGVVQSDYVYDKHMITGYVVCCNIFPHHGNNILLNQTALANTLVLDYILMQHKGTALITSWLAIMEHAVSTLQWKIHIY